MCKVMKLHFTLQVFFHPVKLHQQVYVKIYRTSRPNSKGSPLRGEDTKIQLPGEGRVMIRLVSLLPDVHFFNGEPIEGVLFCN